MNNLQLKARKLVADLINSALIGGWQLSENDKEDELIANEIRKIEADLRSIENQSELSEIKKNQKIKTDSSKMKCMISTDESRKMMAGIVEKYFGIKNFPNEIRSYVKYILEFSSIGRKFPKYKELFESIRSERLGKFALIPVHDLTRRLGIEQQPCPRLDNFSEDVKANENEKNSIKEIIDFLESNYLDCLIDLNK